MDEEKKLMLEYLCHAQEILANVYDYAQRINNGSAETAMSCADSCILDAIDAICFLPSYAAVLRTSNFYLTILPLVVMIDRSSSTRYLPGEMAASIVAC